MQPELVVTGALNWDISMFVERLPRPGEETVVERIERVPGGKGGNVSVAAARILGPKRVALLACLGRDEVGKKQISILNDEGVETSTIQILDEVESGQAYISIDRDGENIIETHFGANALLRLGHIVAPAVQSALANCSLTVVIDPPRGVAGKILADGRRLRRSVMWHPGVLTRLGLAEFVRDMADLDYLVLNRSEALQFTASRGLEESLRKIGKVSPKTRVIVTLGTKGATLYENGKLSTVEGVDLKKLGKKVVNTTGCGDAFVGAFAASKILGREDIEALRYATMAGGLKACRPETRGSPARGDLEDAYKKYFS